MRLIMVWSSILVCISPLAANAYSVFYDYQVYEAVIRWVKHDIEGRKQTLAPLLAKVKLPLLPASYLTQVIS